MIATLPLCPGCFLPLPLDRGQGLRSISAHGERWAVHSFGDCMRLLATAADVVEEIETPTVIKVSDTKPTIAPRSEPPTLPPDIGKVCSAHLAAGRDDLWGSSDLLAAERRVNRSKIEREARRICVLQCPALLACVRYAESMTWAPGISVGGWTSPGTVGTAALGYPHPGLGEVLDQARRDRAEGRRARPERRRAPEPQSDAGGPQIADDRAGIAV